MAIKNYANQMISFGLLLIFLFIINIIPATNASPSINNPYLPSIDHEATGTITNNYYNVSNITVSNSWLNLTNLPVDCSAGDYVYGLNNTSLKCLTLPVNASFNQSLTDTLYSPILWAYNQTTPAINYVNTYFVQFTNQSILNVSTANYSSFSNLSTWWDNLFGIDDYWIIDNGSKYATINETKLNNTIDARTASITYLPSAIINVTGINTDGNITSVQAIDNIFYNVSEVTGTPGWDIRVNFTNVTSFQQIQMVEQYTGTGGHIWAVELWDYNTGAWETQGETFTDQTTLTQSGISVIDASPHINGGLVQLRFYHSSNGNVNHRFRIDYVALQSGFNAFAIIQHDALAGRNSITNHPWAVDINGSRTIDHLNVTNNITAFGNITTSQYFFGNGSYITDLNASSLFNLASLNNKITLDITNITNFLYNYNQTTPAIDYSNTNFYNKTTSDNRYSQINSTGDITNSRLSCKNITGATSDLCTVNVPTPTSQTLFTQSAMSTIIFTAAESSLTGTGVGNLTLAANYLTVGKTIRITARGFYTISGNPTLNLKIKLGNTIIGQTGTKPTGNSLTSVPWELSYMMTVYATGNNGAIIGQGYALIPANTTMPFANGGVAITSGSTTAIDTTVQQYINLTGTWSSSGGNIFINTTNAVIEALN